MQAVEIVGIIEYDRSHVCRAMRTLSSHLQRAINQRIPSIFEAHQTMLDAVLRRNGDRGCGAERLGEPDRRISSHARTVSDDPFFVCDDLSNSVERRREILVGIPDVGASDNVNRIDIAFAKMIFAETGTVERGQVGQR